MLLYRKKYCIKFQSETKKDFFTHYTKMIFATGKTKPVLFCIPWKINLFRNKYSLMAFTAGVKTTKMIQLTIF